MVLCLKHRWVLLDSEISPRTGQEYRQEKQRIIDYIFRQSDRSFLNLPHYGLDIV